MALKQNGNTMGDFIETKNQAGHKNPAKAFMSWEVVADDGIPILDADGVPVLKSDKDIPFWDNPQYKSVSEDLLVELANKCVEANGQPLELTLKVRIKPYVPKERKSADELLSLLGMHHKVA